jgi:hypothetical protein
MNEARYQELLGRVLDDEISPVELEELSGAVRGEPDRLADLQFHLVAWELFSQQRQPERGPESFVAAWRTRLAAETQASPFINRVAEQLEPRPTVRVSDFGPQLASTPSLRDLIRLAGAQRWRAWTALAGCVVLIAVVGFWWFCPTMGEPVLIEVQGTGLSLERAGHAFAAQAGVRLQAGDILHTPNNVTASITFSPEQTRLTLQPGTELKLLALLRGKRFTLGAGRLEASVARQRPLHPMIIATPHAKARVLGTRFSLWVKTNSTRLDVSEGNVRLTSGGDGSAVQVPADHYAIVADATELAALPFTGHIRREFWGGVSATSLRGLQQDPRFSGRPDSWDLANRFELTPVETNRLGVRFRGYLHPPVSGDYEFWLAAATQASLRMSPTENPKDAAQIAQTFDASRSNNWDAPLFRGPSPWSGAIPLRAGRCYYIEALLLVEQGEGHLSVAWKGPNRPRELLTAEFLSPYEPKK